VHPVVSEPRYPSPGIRASRALSVAIWKSAGIRLFGGPACIACPNHAGTQRKSSGASREQPEGIESIEGGESVEDIESIEGVEGLVPVPRDPRRGRRSASQRRKAVMSSGAHCGPGDHFGCRLAPVEGSRCEAIVLRAQPQRTNLRIT